MYINKNKRQPAPKFGKGEKMNTKSFIEILKDSVAENFGAPKEEVWGNYDVTVKEIVLDKPRIILQFPAG